MNSKIQSLMPLFQPLGGASRRVRLISQINLTLKKTALPKSEDAYETARTEALRWLEKRASTTFAENVRRGASFESESFDTHRVSIISLKESNYWAARLDFPDAQVPQRFWVTELGLGKGSDGTTLFGCRLLCVTMGEDVPFARSVPGVVKQIAAKTDVYLDGIGIKIEPKIVSSKSDVEELVNTLQASNRNFDVVAHSVSEGSESHFETAINVEIVANRTFGAAYHYILTSSASYYLTDLVGKDLSVFQKAVRTYRPGFDPDSSDPNGHPLALFKNIESWNGIGNEAFREFLIDRTLSSTIRRHDLDRRLPTFQTVKQVALEQERDSRKEAGATEGALLLLADKEILQLKKQIEDLKLETNNLLDSASIDIKKLETIIQNKENETRGLRLRINFLEALRKSGNEKTDQENIPSTFANLPEWASEQLSGSVVLHPRALRAAKKTRFENPPLAYRALLVLRDQYRGMRLALRERSEYEAALANLNLEDSPCFAGTRSSEFGEEYFIEYDGIRFELDRHLKGSYSRDPRFGFRMYFCWDDTSEQVIVGSFPEHLTTGAT